MTKIETPPLNWSTKISYAAGGIPALIEQRGLSAFLLIFYNQVIGLPTSLVATALLIGSIFDAVCDPTIGQISDNFRSRWGRRHPFLYASAIPLSVCYLAIWCPPGGWSHGMLFGFLLATLLLIRLFDGIFELPAAALLPELTQNYEERTDVVSIRSLFGLFAGMAMTILAYRVFLKERPDGSGGVLAHEGYFQYGLTSAIVIGLAILVCALGTHGRIPYLSKPPKRSASLPAMLREIAATLRNRSFVALLLTGMLMSTANGAKVALELYFNLYFWALTQAQLSLLVVASMVGLVLGVIAAPILARKLGKRPAANVVLVLGILGNGGPVLGRLIGVMPANGTPALFSILLADVGFTFCVATTTTILLTSMMNDVVEDVEVSTGRRSEGLLLAADTVTRKLVSSIGLFVSGMMLTLIAFPAKAGRGSVAPEVVAKLAYCYIPMVIFYLMALAALQFYRIDKGVHSENLNILKRRMDADTKGLEEAEAAREAAQ